MKNILKFFKINKRHLLLLSGFLWIISGFFVFRTGYREYVNVWNIYTAIAGSIAVFLLFYLEIFTNIVNKNNERVKNMLDTNQYFWKCFDFKQYLIMIIMITGGVLIRKYQILPNSTIAIFYTGLGIALFSCGIKFIAKFIRYF